MSCSFVRITPCSVKALPSRGTALPANPGVWNWKDWKERKFAGRSCSKIDKAGVDAMMKIALL